MYKSDTTIWYIVHIQHLHFAYFNTSSTKTFSCFQALLISWTQVRGDAVSSRNCGVMGFVKLIHGRRPFKVAVRKDCGHDTTYSGTGLSSECRTSSKWSSLLLLFVFDWLKWKHGTGFIFVCAVLVPWTWHCSYRLCGAEMADDAKPFLGPEWRLHWWLPLVCNILYVKGFVKGSL